MKKLVLNRVFAVGVLVMFHFGVGLRPQLLADEPVSPSAMNPICGPLAVDRILRDFGVTTDLIRLIDELQSNDARGSSLADLNAALNVRGIHTSPLGVGRNVQIRWHDPVLVHLKGANGSPGHFAVQLPSPDPERTRLWMGPGDERYLHWALVARQRSGAVLLTSTHPIHDPRSATSTNFRLSPFVGAAILTILGSVIWMFCLFLRQRRR